MTSKALDTVDRAPHPWQKAHLAALGRFHNLKTLSCPRWPDRIDQWLESEELVQKVAAAVPSLQLLGLSGQQSEEQWWRIGRGNKDEPSQVDAVTFYSLDLDRACY